jgi:chromosome segregation ATPase
MRRTLLLGMCCAALAAAQPADGDPLAALSQAAQRAEEEWWRLAQDLDARVARMLPCDARAVTAIEDVRKASEARLAALAQYLQAEIAAAQRDTETARGVLTAEREAQAAISLERTDIEQERAGIESQIINLTESARQRASLGAALDQLKQIQGMLRQRADWAAQDFASGDETVRLLGGVVTALETREAALRQQAMAFGVERARWDAYYNERLARARMECTITGGGR